MSTHPSGRSVHSSRDSFTHKVLSQCVSRFVGPFAVSDHMVQQKLKTSLESKVAPLTSKTKQLHLNFLCFDVPGGGGT